MIILASKSPRRRDLLSMIGMEFEVIPSEYEEDHEIESNPKALALAHAEGKAQEVYERLKSDSTYANDIVLGVDTLVFLNGEILGKPLDEKDARNMLEKLSDHTHTVMSAMCVIRLSDGTKQAHLEETEVTFDKISSEDLDIYIKNAEWHDKAGAYAIQGLAAQFVKGMKGDFFNVVGLPINSCMHLLQEIQET